LNTLNEQNGETRVGFCLKTQSISRHHNGLPLHLQHQADCRLELHQHHESPAITAFSEQSAAALSAALLVARIAYLKHVPAIGAFSYYKTARKNDQGIKENSVKIDHVKSLLH
jgi:hypothetical protein